MSPKRVNILLKICLAVLLILAAAGLFFANRSLTATANKTAHLKAEALVDQQQLTNFQKTKAKVDSLGYVNDLANKVLPADKDQSSIVAELTEFALRSDLSVSQISFTDTSKSAASTSTSKSGIATPKGVVVVPVSIQLKSGAKYNDLITFLKTVEGNKRKSQVTNITLTPDTKDRSSLSQVTIALNVYAKQTTTPAAGGKQN